MNLNITQSADGPFKLTGTLDIYSAASLHDALLQQAQSPSGLTLDLSEVTTCDVIALQLLCSARKTAAAAGKRFTVSAVSPAVAEASASVGLTLDTLSTNQPA